MGREIPEGPGMLEVAVVAGITSAGADAIRVGVVPTPAVVPGGLPATLAS